ncbi:hypothetical protein P2L35_12320 [Enterococcus faecium]|nr:hypothetical protein [Enterococcus faecium]
MRNVAGHRELWSAARTMENRIPALGFGSMDPAPESSDASHAAQAHRGMKWHPSSGSSLSIVGPRVRRIPATC